MKDACGKARDDTLGARERDALRALIGPPPGRLIGRAIDEVEREVLLEDLVILMVEAGAAVMHGFVDLATEVRAIAGDDATK